MSRIKEWEELTIADNYLFQKVMRNKELCKRLLEKLLRIKIRDITYLVTEKSVEVSSTQKSVRFDLYLETDEGKVIDVEMQTLGGSKGVLSKRARYYQAMIDLDELEKGAEYDELKKTYVIFICTFDPFPDNDMMIYTFTNRCHEKEGLEFGDETTKIFLNAKGTKGNVGRDMANFLAYVNGSAPKGDFTNEIATEVEKIKQHDDLKVEYMSFMLEMKRQWREGRAAGKAEGKAEGRAEGKAEERLSSVRSLMETLGLSAEKAMDALKIFGKERQEIVALL